MYLGIRVEVSASEMALEKSHHSCCVIDDHKAFYFFSDTSIRLTIGLMLFYFRGSDARDQVMPRS